MSNDKPTADYLFASLNHANKIKYEEYTVFSSDSNAKHKQTLPQSLGNDILSHQHLNDSDQTKTE
jgi:hypothetical protein